MGTNLIKGILPLALFTLSFSTNAQKLPTVQKVSLFAPANIKIDGKSTEWHDKFQAFNHATDLYYTVANDDEYLYFVMASKEHEVIDKIIRGGITITINHAIGKKDADAVSITYPIIRDDDMSLMTNMIARKRYPKINGDTSSTVNVTDLNQLMESKAKQISTTGFKSIGSSISVYNDEGLKIAARFDGKIQYTYEIAISLKLLGLSKDHAFSYNIKVNEPAPMKLSTGKFPTPMIVKEGQEIATTDFWGEYILAKK